MRRALGEGAAQAAPTAPHATPRAKGGVRTGPERFWARWPVRLAFWACLAASAAVHWPVWRFDLPSGFEVVDVEGEGIIPVEILSGEPEPPPPPPPPPPEPAQEPVAPAPAPGEGAARHDGGIADASADAREDASGDASRDAANDGAAVADAASDAATEAGVLDAGNMRDPEAFLAADSVRADKVLVSLKLNAEAIRAHPVGAKLGFLLRGIPQWDDFMSGTNIDPVRDLDWVIISGPSLVRTARDLILIRYNVPERMADGVIKTVSAKYDKGGPFDAGVPGLKATLVHADRAERVLVRPRPHLLAVVPPSEAHRLALVLLAGHIDERQTPGMAMSMRLVEPHRPMPELPDTITEMRLRIMTAEDAGADVFIEGDTKDAATATQAAEEVRRIIRRHNDMFTSMLTHGLLDGVDVSAVDGTVKVHVSATRDQIEAIVALAAGFLGVEPPSPSPGASGAPAPPPAPQGSSPRRRER